MNLLISTFLKEFSNVIPRSEGTKTYNTGREEGKKGNPLGLDNLVFTLQGGRSQSARLHTGEGNI